MFFPSAVGGHSNLMLSWHVLTWGMYSGEIDIKISMILMDHPLSQKYIWLYFQLLTGRTVLRAFWESSSCINIISSVAQLCPTLCNPMNCSTPGFPVLTNSWSLLKLMSIALVMPSNHILCHPLFLLPSIFPNIRQGLFQWVSSLHQVAEVLQFHLQYQSFQLICKTDFL